MAFAVCSTRESANKSNSGLWGALLSPLRPDRDIRYFPVVRIFEYAMGSF